MLSRAIGFLTCAALICGTIGCGDDSKTVKADSPSGGGGQLKPLPAPGAPGGGAPKAGPGAGAKAD